MTAAFAARARDQPLALAKSILECFGSWAVDFFQDDLKAQQFTMDARGTVFMVDGPVVEPDRPLGRAIWRAWGPPDVRESKYPFLPHSCARDADCPLDRRGRRARRRFDTGPLRRPGPGVLGVRGRRPRQRRARARAPRREARGPHEVSVREALGGGHNRRRGVPARRRGPRPERAGRSLYETLPVAALNKSILCPAYRLAYECPSAALCGEFASIQAY